MAARLRVVHCIYDDPRNPWVAGGGAVRVFELYRRLREEVEVTVLTGNFPGARDEEVEGVSYRRLGAPRPYAWSRLSYARAASRELAEGEYDAAVFDHSAYTPIRLPAGGPVGVTVHHVTGPTAAERWGALVGGAIARHERRALAGARVLSATSGATHAILEEMMDPGARLFRVGAGVPDGLFSLGRRDEGFVLFFGRLDWFQKGLDTLLDAVALLARERPGVEVRIAGRGKDRDRVVERARDLGVADRLRVLGAVDDEGRDALFAGASLLLMPSRFEGFGMVAAEAMAAGLPVVAAAAGSLPEVVSPPEGGVLVPVGDPRALAIAAADLLDHPERRAALSETARRSAERFRWDRVARDHLEFIRAIRDLPGRDSTGSGR